MLKLRPGTQGGSSVLRPGDFEYVEAWFGPTGPGTSPPVPAIAGICSHPGSGSLRSAAAGCRASRQPASQVTLKGLIMIITRRGTFAYLAVAAALLTGGIAARADTVTVTATFNNSQPNMVGVDLTSNYNDSDNGLTTTTVDTAAGIYNFTVNSYTGSASSTPLTLAQVQNALGNVNSVFHAVCIDFTHNIGYGQQATWQVANLTSITSNGVGISTTQANAIAYLWGNQPTGTPDQDAVFQMAVWDTDLQRQSLQLRHPQPHRGLFQYLQRGYVECRCRRRDRLVIRPG